MGYEDDPVWQIQGGNSTRTVVWGARRPIFAGFDKVRPARRRRPRLWSLAACRPGCHVVPKRRVTSLNNADCRKAEPSCAWPPSQAPRRHVQELQTDRSRRCRRQAFRVLSFDEQARHCSFAKQDAEPFDPRLCPGKSPHSRLPTPTLMDGSVFGVMKTESSQRPHGQRQILGPV